MASHGTDQLLVQRLLTCRNQRESQKALDPVAASSCFAQFALFLTIGMMLHAYYAVHPLPPMATNDEIFPAFIVRSLPHGIAGLVIAAIFAAAMSNLSGSLNSLASTTVLDFYQPLTGGARRRRAAAAAVALADGGVGAGADRDRDPGARLGIGVHRRPDDRVDRLRPDARRLPARRADDDARTSAASIAGIGVSLAAMIGVRVFTPLAWTWYVLAGTAICMSVGLVVSRVSR